MPKHTKLTFPERKLIGLLLKDGVSLRDCARKLHRSHTTISREIKRNPWKDGYEPLHAQGLANKRKKKAWEAKHPLRNKDIYSYAIEKLTWGWSPETISGRLREIDHPGDPHWSIRHETIYQFVYSDKAKKIFLNKPLYEYLRRKQKRRVKQHGRSSHKVRIPDRVSIHDRPRIIERRNQFGHWEGDTIVGRGRDHGVHTAYERLTSLVRVEKMPDLTASSSLLAQYKIYSKLPVGARKSVTLDNGHEHVLHTRLRELLGTQSYFADTYASYQRGGNENSNLWLRYYFPKGTDFRTISDEELREVEYDLNSRPRKRLGYQTPLEVFTKQLHWCDRK